MSSLTDAALYSKKAVIWIVLGIALLLFLIIFLGLGKRLKNAVAPPKPPPATVAFGILQKMDLSEGLKAPAGANYTLETVSGDLPLLAGTAKVFAIGTPQASFGDLDRIKQKAADAKFSEQPLEIKDNLIKFVDPSNKTKILALDKTTGNFELTSGYFSDTEIVTSSPGDLKSAVSISSEFFENFLNSADFPEEMTTTKLKRIDGGTLSDALSLSGANLIQVDFFRGNLDKLPVIWPKEKEAKVSALVSLKGIVWAKMEILPIKKYSFSSYPLKGTAKAFENLKAGAGAFNKPVTNTEIAVQKVYLGYMESIKNADFLQPVYIFECSGDALAYVPALADNWIKN